MPSRFISALESGDFDDETKALIKEDLRAIAAMQPKVLAGLKTSFERLLPIRLPKTFNEELRRQADKLGIREAEVSRAYRVMKSLGKYFHQGSQGEVDEPSEVTRALAAMGFIDKASITVVQQFLACIRDVITGAELQQDRALRIGSPELVSIEAAIDFRTFFSTELEFGDAVPATPGQFAGLIPFVTLQLVHDLSEIPDYVLTCRPETLDRLIDILQATRTRLSNAQAVVRQKTSS